MSIRGHLVESLSVQTSISLHVVGSVVQDGFEQPLHVIRIHLSISGHDHADELGIEHAEEVLVAHVNGRADAVSSSLKDDDLALGDGVLGALSRLIQRTVINDDGDINQCRKALNHFCNVVLFIPCWNDHADVPTLQHGLWFLAASINLCLKQVSLGLKQNRFDRLKVDGQVVSQPLERVVLLGRDIELRIVSLIIRCREVAKNVLFFDTGSNDETVELATEVGCEVVHHDADITPQNLSKALLSLDAHDGLTMFLPISPQWKLSDLPLSVNRAREGWDIHHLYREESNEDEGGAATLASTELVHLVVSNAGANHLSNLPRDATPDDISDEIRARFVKSDAPIQLPQRQSLATASRFAQLFYWMLESKHPLLLFGIPGVVLFVLGYRLSGDIATMFTELNSTSIGVTLVTIAMTLIGLFAMMVALILYIMGKQVARVQHQYNWPKGG